MIAEARILPRRLSRGLVSREVIHRQQCVNPNLRKICGVRPTREWHAHLKARWGPPNDRAFCTLVSVKWCQVIVCVFEASHRAAGGSPRRVNFPSASAALERTRALGARMASCTVSGRSWVGPSSLQLRTGNVLEPAMSPACLRTSLNDRAFRSACRTDQLRSAPQRPKRR